MSSETKGRPKSALIDNLEVCRMLGVKPDTWRKRVQAGTAPMPHSRMGSRSYYRRADVLAFIREGEWPHHLTFRGLARGRSRPSPA